MCDEVEAEVERVLLDHLAAAEAGVVLELHPRIPFEKKYEIENKNSFFCLQ